MIADVTTAGELRLALEAMAPGQHAARAAQQLRLGEVLRVQGDTVGARTAFLDAARHARSVGDAELLGGAALGYGLGAGGLHRALRCDLQHIALLEEALAALGPVESRLRVRLLARLAEELYFTPEHVARASLVAEAVAMARRIGSPEVLLPALHARALGLVGPDVPVQERLDDAAELIALARELGDEEATYLGHMLRELALVEAGRIAEGMGELDGAERAARAMGVPGPRSWAFAARGRQHWLAGRFAEAEAANAVAFADADEHGGDPEVFHLVLGGQLLSFNVLRADLAPFLPALLKYTQEYGHFVIIECFIVYLLADSGDLAGARERLSVLGVNGFGDMVRNAEWSGSMWACGRAAYLAGDTPTATSLYGELLPVSGRWFADWVSTCQGPVDTVLGLVGSLCQRAEVVDRHFEAAVAQARAAPSPPWLADALVQYAAVRLRRDPRDVPARALLAEGLRLCTALGIDELGRRAQLLADA